MKARRRLASVETEIARVGGLEPRPPAFIGGAWMVGPSIPAPPELYEVVQHHPATCRTNLLAWGLTGPEASRILDELQRAQGLRQGAIIVGAKAETGWKYLARPQGRERAA